MDSAKDEDEETDDDPRFNPDVNAGDQQEAAAAAAVAAVASPAAAATVVAAAAAPVVVSGESSPRSPTPPPETSPLSSALRWLEISQQDDELTDAPVVPARTGSAESAAPPQVWSSSCTDDWVEEPVAQERSASSTDDWVEAETPGLPAGAPTHVSHV